jgi:hypothetical protein
MCGRELEEWQQTIFVAPYLPTASLFAGAVLDLGVSELTLARSILLHRQLQCYFHMARVQTQCLTSAIATATWWTLNDNGLWEYLAAMDLNRALVFLVKAHNWCLVDLPYERFSPVFDNAFLLLRAPGLPLLR